MPCNECIKGSCSFQGVFMVLYVASELHSPVHYKTKYYGSTSEKFIKIKFRQGCGNTLPTYIKVGTYR